MTIKHLIIALAVTHSLSLFADANLDALKEKYQRPETAPTNPENPMTAASIDLGKNLFFDTRISGSGMLSCASCHNPSLSWEDGLETAVGHGHKKLGRSTPTILNAAWNKANFWDGRAETLEEQALGPIEAAGEMNMPLEKMLGVLNAIPEYAEKFEKAYPGEGISNDTVAKAIANFERTIISGEAPFDRWIKGDEDAISESAKAGFVIFNNKANCAACHSGWNFSDSSFHDIGVKTSDKGRGGLLDLDFMNYSFKTPTLRNIKSRAPYMHNGTERDLKAVVELYNNGGREQRATLSKDVRPLNLDNEEIEDLIEFLKTLSSEDQEMPMPRLPTA